MKKYAAIEQRWLLVESQKRKESDLKKLEKKIKKDWEASIQKLRELSSQEFAGTAEALKAASRLLKKSKYHELIDLKVTRVNNSKTFNSVSYKVAAKVAVSEERVGIEKRSAGGFVWATNLLNAAEFTGEEMLLTYKEQQSVEGGFSFRCIPDVFN